MSTAASKNSKLKRKNGFPRINMMTILIATLSSLKTQDQASK